MSNLGDLKLKTKKVNNETLASTRRMLGLVNESQDAGAKTLQMLHTQGDQLNNIDGGLDNIHESLLQSEKHLKHIEKVEKFYCCVFCQKQRKRKQRRQDAEQSRLKEDKTVNDKATVINGHNSSSSKSQFSVCVRHPKGEVIHGNSGADETENNLDEIIAHISTLKGQAVKVGQVATSHNNQIRNINIKAATNQGKVKDVSGIAENLLKPKSSTFLSCKYCRHLATFFRP